VPISKPGLESQQGDNLLAAWQIGLVSFRPELQVQTSMFSAICRPISFYIKKIHMPTYFGDKKNWLPTKIRLKKMVEFHYLGQGAHGGWHSYMMIELDRNKLYLQQQKGTGNAVKKDKEIENASHDTAATIWIPTKLVLSAIL